MNERQEQTADVLGKLTVLGTIVLPMNIVTGMWGMNVLVPGQDVDNLYWFWSSKSRLYSVNLARDDTLADPPLQLPLDSSSLDFHVSSLLRECMALSNEILTKLYGNGSISKGLLITGQ